MDEFQKLFDTIEARKQENTEGSYTCYLFSQGIDKILKKLGEETSETIIAAKNGEQNEVVLETCDLIFHLFVMLSSQNIPLEKVTEELEKRSAKIGNLKQFKKTDKNT